MKMPAVQPLFLIQKVHVKTVVHFQVAAVKIYM